MTLTIGRGPFGPNAGGTFNFRREGPAHVLYFEDSPRRVRAELGGETVADSSRMKLLHETGLLPVYYFPRQDVQWDLLEASDHSTHCPFKGDARYWNVRAGGRAAEAAAWAYPEPIEGCPHIADYVAFYWGKMDAWFEEDEEIVVHPRDPYHRIDIRRSSRQVRVTVFGRVVAETGQPSVLFETGLPPRYYIPVDDVREQYLMPTETITHCPYKGAASYWSVTVGERIASDVVWAYENPLPEALDVEGYRCFHGEDVVVEVDGEPVP